MAAIGALSAAVLLALDPYDTGRFALVAGAGVPAMGQRFVAASLGRQGSVDTAIIGNSTLQLVDPARLGALSGGRAVSLTIPGSGPREQLAVAEWFRRHHPGAALRGVVIGIDASWCRGDGRLPLAHPFPFWLYAESAGAYALGMLRLQSFEAAGRKVTLLLGRARPARPDGYDDFELGRRWDADAAAAQSPRSPALDARAGAAATDFAAVPLLRRFLAELDPSTPVVLAMPPRHHHALPAPESAAAKAEQACKAAFATLAQQRPGTALVDFVDRPGMRENEMYWDLLHYRAPVARAMEAEIAAAMVPETR